MKINPKQKKEFRTIGRPTQMTPETIQRLREGFCYSCTDTEACLFAGISTTTFYEWLKKNPDFQEEKEMLKKNISMKAKLNIAKSIEKDNIENSKRWLPRKAKEEFSERQEHTGAEGKDLIPKVNKEQADRLIKNYLSKQSPDAQE